MFADRRGAEGATGTLTSENSVKKLSEKSGAGSNQYLIKRRKWLDRAPFWRIALPQSHHEGFFDYFSDCFMAKFGIAPIQMDQQRWPGSKKRGGPVKGKGGKRGPPQRCDPYNPKTGKSAPPLPGDHNHLYQVAISQSPLSPTPKVLP
jgi:hypothetical protein